MVFKGSWERETGRLGEGRAKGCVTPIINRDLRQPMEERKGRQRTVLFGLRTLGFLQMLILLSSIKKYSNVETGPREKTPVQKPVQAIWFKPI